MSLEKLSFTNVFKILTHIQSCRQIINTIIDFRTIADRYKTKPEIPSLNEIRRVLKCENWEDNIPSECETDLEEDEEDGSSTNAIIRIRNPKKVEEMLLDFFSNTYVIPKCKIVAPAELKQGVEDVKNTLSVLNVNLTIPEDIGSNEHLDALDVKILHSLSLSNKSRHQTNLKKEPSPMTQLIPPNLFTVVGLRGLLIRHLQLKNKDELPQLASNMRNPFSLMRKLVAHKLFNCEIGERDQIESDLNLFYRRFHSLFKYPSMMTLHAPSPILLNCAELLPQEKLRQVKRTYSRIRANESSDSKHLKLSDNTSEPTKVLKLMPVSNKSVIQDLMQNKSKKLFTLRKINQNGAIKTVINEIKCNFDEPAGAASSSINKSSTTEEMEGTLSSLKKNSVSTILNRGLSISTPQHVEKEKEQDQGNFFVPLLLFSSCS